MMKYEDIINNTIVPGNIAYEEKNKLYKDVNDYVLEKMPEKLYRFRRITERNIDAFYKDELWFSSGRTMNDDFDSRMYYDKTKLFDWINFFFSNDGRLKILAEIIDGFQLPESMLEEIPYARIFIESVRKMSEDQERSLSNKLVANIMNNLEGELEYIAAMQQESVKFASFTDKIDSDMMWGQYAENATGFAIEYNFDRKNIVQYRDEKTDKINCEGRILPILYGNTRLDATEYAKYLFHLDYILKVALERRVCIPKGLLDCLVSCPDEFMIYKVAIKKSCDWKQEKEWRMFYYGPTNIDENFLCVKQKPSAVYLGRKISDINQKIIVDIAREKGIPIYKMGFNDLSKTYKLKKYKFKYD